MSQRVNCPGCGRVLQLPPGRAGRRVACGGCGTAFTAPPEPEPEPPVAVPEEAVPDEPPQPAAPPVPARRRRPEYYEDEPPARYRDRDREEDEDEPPRRRRRPAPPPRAGDSLTGLLWAARWYFVAAAVLLVAAALGWALFLRSDVRLYVDNGGAEPLEVSIDGEPRGVVAPNTHLVISCRSGVRHVRVTAAGRTVLEEVKELPGRAFGNTRFILNPGKDCFYWFYKVEYSSDMTAWRGPKQPVPRGSPPDVVRAAHNELAREVNVATAEPWLDVTKCDYVLEKPPRSITMSSSQTKATREAVLHLTLGDYQSIMRARSNRAPTDEDYEHLLEVVGRVLLSGE